MIRTVLAHLRAQWMGALALFLVLTGGIAYAADTIGSTDIINGQVKSVDIGNNQVRPVDVRDDSLSGGGLGSADIANDSLTGADIDESQLDLSDTIGNAIVFFEGACPTGWSEFTAAQGRYLVGLPSGGTLSATVGTALTDGENRAVGQHDHGGATSSAGSHNHTYSDLWGYNNTPDVAGVRRPVFDFKPVDSFGKPDVDAFQSGGTHSHSIPNAGSIAGTNAPYIELRACKLDT